MHPAIPLPFFFLVVLPHTIFIPALLLVAQLAQNKWSFLGVLRATTVEDVYYWQGERHEVLHRSGLHALGLLLAATAVALTILFAGFPPAVP